MYQYRVLNDFGGRVGNRHMNYSRGETISSKSAAKFPNLKSLEKAGFLTKEDIEETDEV
jgi:hypothetical protein